MKRFFAVFSVICMCLGARADTVGTVNTDGYLLGSNGYYSRPGSEQLYYRTQEWVEGYWTYPQVYYGCYSAGRYTPGYYRHTYHAYNAPPIVQQFPTYKPFDWKEAVERWKLAKLDHEAYLQTQRELNAGSGPIAAPPAGGGLRLYGQGGNYSLHGQGQTVTQYGVTGNTVYGYPVGPNSYTLASDFYSDANALAMYQISGQLINNLENVMGQGLVGHQSILDKFEQNRAKFAVEKVGGVNYLLKAQGMALLVDSLNRAFSQAPITQTQGFSFKFVPNPQTGLMSVQRVEDGVKPDQRKMLNASFVDLWQAKCSQCHAGANAKANFTLDAYQKMSVDDKAAAPKGPWHLINTGAMPKEGGPLTDAEKRLFFLN